MFRRSLLPVAIGVGLAAVIVACWVPALDPLELEWQCTAASDCADGMVCAKSRCAFPDRTLQFTAVPSSATAGECLGSLQIESQDPTHAPLVVQVPVRVSLTASGPSATQPLRFYSASDCSAASEVTWVEIPAAGSSTPAFYVRTTMAGAWTITGHATNYAVDAVHLAQVAAAVPASVVFLTGPQDLALHLCSEAATVQVRDVYDNPVPAPAPTTVSLTSTGGGGFQFFSDPACTAAITSAARDLSASDATFYFMSLGTPGSVTISATDGPRVATQSVSLESRVAAQLVFITPAQTVPRDSCSAAATVQLQDPAGKAAPALVTTAIGLGATPNGALSFFSDSACTQSVGSTDILANNSKATVYFRGNAEGSATITAVTTSFVVQQTESITPPVPTHMAFLTAPQAVVAGGCSAPVVVETRGALNTAFTMPADTVVTFSSPSLLAYSNSACNGAPRTSVIIQAGTSSATIWFYGTVAGPVDLQAETAGLIPAIQTETVTPAAAQRVAFASPPLTVAAGSCSSAVTVQLLDAYDNPTSVGTPVTANLAITPPGAASVYGTAGCGAAPLTSFTFAAGASSSLLYFKGTTAQGLMLSVTPTNSVVAAAQSQTIGPAAPASLRFASAVQSVVAGACSAPVTLEANDAYNNLVPAVAPVTIGLAASLPNVQFFASSDCTGTASTSTVLAAGQTSVTYSFIGTTIGSGNLTATSSLTAPPGQPTTITPDAPVSLAFGAGPASVVFGTCSGEVRLDQRDTYGNLSPGATVVTIGTTGVSGVSLYAGTTCAGSAVTSVTLGAASSSVQYSFKGTVVGAGTLTVASALAGPSPRAFSIVAAPPSELRFNTAQQSVTAGVCSGVVQLNAYDPGGNPSSPASSTAINLGSGALGGVTFYAGAGCSGGAVTQITLGTGQTSVTYSFRGINAGTGALSVTSALPTNPAAQPVTVTPAAPASLTFGTTAQTVAAGVCSGNVVLNARDSFNNLAPPVSNVTINLSSNLSNMTFYSGPGCTGAGVTAITLLTGQSSATYSFKGTTASTGTLSASAPPLTGPPSQAVTIQPGPPAAVAFGSAPQVINGTGCNTQATPAQPLLKVQVVDQYGNVTAPAANTTIALGNTGTPVINFYNNTNCTNSATSVNINPPATFAQVSLRSSALGTGTITATPQAPSTLTAPTPQPFTIQ